MSNVKRTELRSGKTILGYLPIGWTLDGRRRGYSYSGGSPVRVANSDGSETHVIIATRSGNGDAEIRVKGEGSTKQDAVDDLLMGIETHKHARSA